MKKHESGQALVILIFAIALSITILTSVTLTVVTLAKNIFLTEESHIGYYAAESGVEYALLKLTRDPAGCGGTNDNLTIGTSVVTVAYSLVGSTCTVLVESTTGTVFKKVQIQATLANSKVTYCCWKELP